MTYSHHKYDPADIVLSIGYFDAASLKQWQAHTLCKVVDYEATPELWKAKCAVLDKSGRVECHNLAVSDRTGEATLYYYRAGPIGNTIIEAWQDQIQPQEYFTGKSKIKTVAMNEVLARFPHVRELYLNCEGSEIPILMNTPLELLGRCQYIACEFHRFSSFLAITEGDVRACVARLEPLFEAKCVENYHPFYEFTRKGGI